MIIQINTGTRIHGTKDCWQLEKRRSRKGKESWEPYKYFTTFRQALGAAGQEEIRTHPAETVAEALEAVSQLTAKYAGLFDANHSKSKRTALGMKVVS